MLRRLFLDHPHAAGESYLAHQRIAFGFGASMVVAGIACVIHGLIPCLFQRTASSTVTALHARMLARQAATPHPRAESLSQT